MIKLYDLNNPKIQNIKKLLLKEDPLEIEIAIQMPHIQFFSTYYDLSEDFLNAAFAGEELSRVSKKIDYYGGDCHTNDDLVFEIKPKSIDELAEKVYFLVQFFNDSSAQDFTIADSLENFIEFAERNEITFRDLYDQYKEFLELAQEDEENEDDNDDDENEGIEKKV